MKNKIGQLVSILDDIKKDSTRKMTRADAFMYAELLDAAVKYRMVDIEENLLEKHFQADCKRMTLENADYIIKDYPAGFYRSEIRVTKNMLNKI